jgi:hypothetical protein
VANRRALCLFVVALVLAVLQLMHLLSAVLLLRVDATSVRTSLTAL